MLTGSPSPCWDQSDNLNATTTLASLKASNFMQSSCKSLVTRGTLMIRLPCSQPPYRTPLQLPFLLWGREVSTSLSRSLNFMEIANWMAVRQAAKTSAASWRERASWRSAPGPGIITHTPMSSTLRMAHKGQNQISKIFSLSVCLYVSNKICGISI